MVKIRKIAIVGAGGINSWVCKHLSELMIVFEKTELVYIKVFDNDYIEEKNILRQNQNFDVESLMEQKAETLAKKYNFEFENIFITEENISVLDEFDDIIMGVDSNKVRSLLYKYTIENKKYLLDLRAQGTQMAFYVVDGTETYDYYKEKFFNNEELMNKKGSCQLKNDIKNDHIENANKIIAFFGINGIYFKHVRDEEVNTNEWHFAY